jgi:hypothetical protein
MFGVPLKFLYPIAALTLLLAACAEPAPTTPNAPSSVSAASGISAPSLTWQDKSSNEEGFVIYRDTLSATNAAITSLEPLAELSANITQFEDTTATADARYIYYVAAKNALGASETVRQTGEAVRVRPAFEVVVGSATTSDWRFSGVLTAFLLLVHEDSAKPQSDVTVTITGPQGWNKNQPYTFTTYLGEFGRDVLRLAPNTPLVSGTYTTNALVNGQSYVTSSDVSTDMTLATSSLTFDFKAAQRSADLTWTSVAGASSYRAYVGASDINIAGHETLGQSAEFKNLQLNPAEYTGRVYAFNYDTTLAVPERPFPQLMVSLGESSNVEIVAFTDSTFAKVDPSARYLLGDSNDTGKPATAFSLSTLGVQPGECVGLMRQGDFKSDSIKPDLSPDMIAVFSNGAGFLNPGALGNQSSEYTTPTTQDKKTDITEDFLVPGRQITVQIPSGATQLLVSADDVRNSDNTDPDSDFGILHKKVSCPGAALQMEAQQNLLK